MSELLPLASHEDVVGFDVPTTIQVNYEWRVFLAALISRIHDYNSKIVDDAEIDNLNRVFNDFFVDFYT